MTRIRLAVALLFIAAFGAGLAVGLSWRPEKKEDDRRGRRDSWLARELKLSPQQQEQMQKIWGDLGGRDGWREDAEKRRQIQQQRDEAIRDLIPADRHAELDKAIESASQQMADLSAQRRRAFDRAVEQTRSLLTAEQRVKYEQLMSRRGEHGGRPGARSGGPPGPPGAPGAPGAPGSPGTPIGTGLRPPRESAQPSGTTQPQTTTQPAAESR